MYKKPIVFEKRRTKKKQRKEKFFSSSILPKWVHHILSYTVATFQSLGEQKKKKKEEEWKHGKNRGEKKIESKWMSTNAKWDAINFAYSDAQLTREKMVVYE